MMARRGMKKTDLIGVISGPTITKLNKGLNVNTDIINSLCKHFKVQPSDIMEYIPDEK